MLRTVSSGIVAGTVAALLAAAIEPLVGDGATYLPSMLTAAGLLLPVGLLVGVSLVAVRGLLPREQRPADWLRALSATDAPDTAARILAAGLIALASLAIGYRVILFFLTSFNHHGLAALTLAACLAGAALAAALAFRRLGPLLARALRRAPRALGFIRRPLAAVMFTGGCWCAALIPPVLAGPQSGGAFGFVGLLTKEGLGAGPLISLLGVVVAAGLILAVLLRARDRRWPIPLGAILLVGALLGPVWADRQVAAAPEVLDRLDASGTLSPWLGRLARRLGDADGDGHARWMGGMDCDDRNPAVNPGARDVPDNGVDEDCSGQDLELAALEPDAAAAPAEPSAGAEPGGAPQRPPLPDDVSLLLITIDSFRWDGVGFMGYERDTTPNLDALVARGGTVYERAHALGSYTGQAVPPLLTGKYASELHRTDRHEVRIFQDETFAAEQVCSEQVRCAGVLSHFLFRAMYGWNQGFQDWEVVTGSPPDASHSDHQYSAHNVTDAAIKWLKKPEKTAGRFWLWVHYMEPHKEYLSHPGFESFGDDRRAMYDNEVRFADHHVGRLLDYFFTLPASDRTVVIVTGDHGEAFGEHGRVTHGKELWEEIIRVPLAVVGPGVATKRIRRQTSLIDLYPTILDLFGVEVPPGTHGRSLLPDWVEDQELPERPVIADQPQNPYYETRRVYIKDGWKLHHLPDTGGWRLFRITDDYERGESLVKSEPERFAEIRAAYELFLAREFKPRDPVPVTPER